MDNVSSSKVLEMESKKESKKEIRKTIREKLSLSLADYKSIIGEKKFNRGIRRAARLLGAEVVKAKPQTKKTPKEKA